jgi:hypothetical protein
LLLALLGCAREGLWLLRPLLPGSQLWDLFPKVHSPWDLKTAILSLFCFSTGVSVCLHVLINDFGKCLGEGGCLMPSYKESMLAPSSRLSPPSKGRACVWLWVAW